MDRVEKIHFIWYGPRALDYVDYLGVQTAATVYGVKPLFWVCDVPENEYFKKIRQIAKIKQISELPGDVLAACHEIGHPRHRADYLRMELVHRFGGMYSDLDVLWVKSFFDLGLPIEGLTVVHHGDDTPAHHRIGNALIYAAGPGDPVLTEAIDLAKRSIPTADIVGRNSPLGLEIMTEVIQNTIGPHTILPKETLLKYHWNDFEEGRELLSSGGTMDEAVCGVHWWRTFLRSFMQGLIDADFARHSDSLLANYIRCGLGVR